MAVIAGILLCLAFNSVESMKLEKEHLVRLPVWKMDELPEGSIALDKPMESGENAFRLRRLKTGRLLFRTMIIGTT